MKNTVLLLIVLLSALLLPANTYAQNRCGHEELMELLLQDPQYLEAHQQKLARAALMAEQHIGTRMDCEETIILPVAIHFQNVANPDRPCLEELAMNQIETANQDFQGTNPDIDTWVENQPTFFPDIQNGEACIQFCIATQNHPSGYDLSDGDLAVTINEFSNSFNSDWSGYINIFVRDFSFLGSSPLGGNGNGDGVNVDKQAFGTAPNCGELSPGAPYNLGRTLTHELGHYFLLSHIWQSNGCGVDDFVSDTPLADDEYFGCPSIGASSCGSTDMHMNYMDYTNDACMYAFSAGQVNRMEDYINANLQNVIANAALVCSVVNDPTCDDGIQNGNETGVDCGGPDCPVCPVEPTCDDGIQNGNETGVDCGGPDCPACPVEPTCDDGIQNGNETGVDCGGPDCPACPVEPTCNDGIQNGNETGVDCGGPDCAPCATNCVDHTLQIILDLVGNQTTWSITTPNGMIVAQGGPYVNFSLGSEINETICLEEGCYSFNIYDSAGNGICCRAGQGSYTFSGPNGVIASGAAFGFSDLTDFCVGDLPEPTCEDGIQNGNETGVDCGGPDCPACPVEPTCDDGIQNGNETGVDCGGPDCPACPVEPTCDDGIQNGNETGVDCGGPDCPACPVEPTCDDGIQNGNETGVDCGGPDCPACPVEPTCDDGIQNGNETGVDCGGPDCAPCEEVDCPAPTGNEVTYFDSPFFVRVSWNPVPGATEYEVRYRVEGFVNWTTLSTTSTSVLIWRLAPSTTYEYQIRALCASGWSDYTADTFTTNAARLGADNATNAIEVVELYPNPTTDLLVLELQSVLATQTRIRVYDVLGREVLNRALRLESGANRLELNVSEFSAGYYLLSIQQGTEQITKGFVKQ